MKRREPSAALVWVLSALVAVGALVTRRVTPQSQRGADPRSVRVGYEHSDMRPAVVIAGAVGLLVAIGLLLLGVTVLETVVTGVPPAIGRPADLIGGQQAAPQPTPPAPALESEPGQTLDPYMAGEQARLNSYRWVDRSAGVAAIPIDRAMDLIAQQGLPARPSTSARDAGNVSPSTASSGRVEAPYP